MKKIKKVVSMILASVMIFSIPGLTTYAASKQKISTVSLSFESEIKPDQGIDIEHVEVDTKGSSYSVGEYEFTNQGFAWDITDVPQLKIYLHASDNYYFSLTSSKSVKLSGAGASYVSATKQDSAQTLVVTVNLSPLSETLGEIAEVSWSSIGQALWSEAAGAGMYEVRLNRNGNGVGASKVISGTTCDFTSIMTKAANYSFKVRAVNKTKVDIKGPWIESGVVYIDDEQARIFRESGGLSGWKQDHVGWWYRNIDGSFAMENWQEIDNKWYYFNAQGYMVTGWIQWNDNLYFCTENGDMLVDATTPDGFTVGSDGMRDKS